MSKEIPYQTPMSNQECILIALKSLPQVESISQSTEVKHLAQKGILKRNLTYYSLKMNNRYGKAVIQIDERKDGTFSAINGSIPDTFHFIPPVDKELFEPGLTMVNKVIEDKCGVKSAVPAK